MVHEDYELARTESLCRTPKQELLQAVENNEVHKIRGLINANPELLSVIYDHPYNNPILYIAIYGKGTVDRSESVDTLIELGADLFYHDDADNNKEAIHYAVLAQNPSLLRTILKHIKSVDKINSTANGNTALNLLIKECRATAPNFEKCLGILLSSDVDVNKSDLNGRTPIFEAARKKYKNAVTKIINCGKYVSIDTCISTMALGEKTARMLIEEYKLYDGQLPPFTTNNNNPKCQSNTDLIDYIKTQNEEKFLNFSNIKEHVNDSIDEGTLLQLACAKNLKNIVKNLLENEADVCKVTEKNQQSPIEITGRNGFWKIFEDLLPHYKQNSKLPDNLLTILLQNIIHETTSPDIDYSKCLSLLLKQNIAEIPVNAYYTNGNTPLHYSVKYANSEITLDLLKRGASLANKNWFDILPVDDIDAKTLENHFDSCLTAKHSPTFDKQSTIVTFNYKSLIPTGHPEMTNKVDIESDLIPDKNTDLVRETDVVLAISRSLDLRYLLNHPLISSFLYIKWLEICWFFYVNLIFYSLFVLSLVLHVFLSEGENRNSLSFLNCTVLILTYAILSLREVLQILISPKTYFMHFENLLEISLIVITGIILFNPDVRVYKQLSAIAILLSSLEMMLLIGQHPNLSTNIVIFRTVSLNFFKFLLWYSILIIAFVLSFYKLFNSTGETNKANYTMTEEKEEEQDFFMDPGMTFIKIIVMLTGEFDASSLNLGTVSNRLLFLVFVFLIPIILFNLLNGLAVSDTQVIKNDAEIIGHTERINHIVYIENMMLGNIIPSSVRYLLSKCKCCCPSANLKKYAAPNWLGDKISLFPHAYENYEMKIYLYHDGKIIRPNVKGCCKKCKEMYLDKKSVKRVKLMLAQKDDVSLVEKVGDLEKQIKILQELLSKSININK